jgi:murein DD-endopeptidase MepM/ murein hydrolase activator NlpD
MMRTVLFLVGWSALGLASCAKDEDPGAPPVLDVPYAVAQEAKVRVDNVFVAANYSNPGGTPFGVHLGIHYSPTAAHNADMPYYAMADGKISKIESLISAGRHNVNVQQEMSGNVIVVYQFETESSNAADGMAQLGKIAVSVGQEVARGTLIGTLHDAGAPDPILHVGVIQGADLICPTKYMSAVAVVRTNALLLRDNPTWLACYQN